MPLLALALSSWGGDCGAADSHTAVLVRKNEPSHAQPPASVKPAEVVVVPLSEIDVPNDVDTATVAGAVTDVLLKDGSLRFSTPGDTGEPQHARFRLSGPNGTIVLLFSIVTERPRSPLLHVEFNDDGRQPKNSLHLSLDGLGPHNSINDHTLTFKLAGAPSADLREDSDGLAIGPGNAAVSLKQFWTYDRASTAFTIAGPRLQQLKKVLPAGALTVSLNFVSKDGQFASNYTFLAIHQGARVIGKVVMPDGIPVTTLAGRKILLRGQNDHLRLVAPVDEYGQFIFDDVIPDTYQLTLNDLENPNAVSVSTTVPPGTKMTQVSIPYPPGKTNPGTR